MPARASGPPGNRNVGGSPEAGLGAYEELWQTCGTVKSSDANFSYPPFHPQRSDLPLSFTAGDFRAAFPEEGQYIEFKRGAGSKPLQQTVVAFSNADGGVIVIGVDDDGSIVGKALDAGTSDAIHQAMQWVHDPGRYSLHQFHVDGTSVVALAVARREEGFAQQSNGIVRVRKGTMDQPLFGMELQQLVNRRTAHRYERTRTRLDVTEVDPGLLDGFRRAFSWSPEGTAERLEEEGYSDGGELTVAGALYLVPDPREALGKAFVEVLRYDGDESIDYDLRLEFAGPLGEQLESASERILELLGTEMVILGVRRHELPRIPPVVLREVLANALAHRSYELDKTPVRVEIRPSMIQVISPGGLPEPVTVENIRETTAPRNIAVITALRRFGLAEDAGRGIDVIQDTLEEEMLDPPVIEDRGHSVAVTLSLHSVVAPEERAWVAELEHRGTLNGRDRLLLVHAARGEKLTNSRAREILQSDSVEAREALTRLRDLGLLNQEGQRGGANYRLEESLSPPAGLRMDRLRLLDLVEELARQGPLRNADVRSATGLDRIEARALLAELVVQGRLIQVGERRGTRYLVPEADAAN